jgi:hypothetical protein
MKPPIKILHIDINYQVVYMVIFNGVQIKSSLPMETALLMLENERFDFIFSEPQRMAVLTPLTASDNMESIVESFSNCSV